EYQRVTEEGREMILNGTYTAVEGGIPFWKWILSPFLSLGAEGGGSTIAIMAFLMVIGGAFTALDAAGVMAYMLGRIRNAFQHRKYMLLVIMCLFFMCMGSFVGSFEECVPLVPIAVALACSLGWDSLVGMGMSLLAVACGFSAGVCNPFTVGVAQELAGLPMFSGMSFRLLTFVLIYGLLLVFLLSYAKRIEKDPSKSLVYDPEKARQQEKILSEFTRDAQKDKALICFGSVLGFGVLLIFLSSVIPFLQDIIMPLVAVIFLAAGISATLVSGMKAKELWKQFGSGIVSILPAVLLILMASSIRYTMAEAKILDTILHSVVGLTEGASKGVVSLLIYLLVLVMNFFISSGSAKAFLLMPLIAPLADLAEISRQTAVLAFVYGDGFSNVFYPTNPVVLISLGMIGLSYGKWAKWTVVFQLAIIAVTSGLLLLATAVGY
ncbi:MAG: YfcC family protein, partial [Firmicutes bacterium]|nr:YfcC family protein [Bacillota bacterium]